MPYYQFPFFFISTFNDRDEYFREDAPEPELHMFYPKSETFYDFTSDTIFTRTISTITVAQALLTL